ncbi:MAG: Maf family protein [Acidocella sp.]|uniref:Maf family protein n=1 Tax=Acidocella sp. TaxID=50710 RepID=UPI003FBC7C95
MINGDEFFALIKGGAAPRLILASTSAARQAMLRQAGLDFAAIPSGVDEAALKQGFAGTPEELALALAAAKARAVGASHPGALVLGADQLLVCDGAVFDKPADLDEAAAHLRRLSGRTHQLVTAACVVTGGEIAWSHVERATLSVRELSEAFIARYLAAEGKEVLGCVGAYRLEGLGAQLFTRIEGDHFTILGLSLLPLLGFLRGAGVLAA